MKQKTCAERIDEAYADQIKRIRDTFYNESDDFNEVGYGFDYVARGVFKEMEQGYFRWTLSGGGPSSEIRFYLLDEFCAPMVINRIEYWFMDWFDGAKIDITGDDFNMIKECAEDIFYIYDMDFDPEEFMDEWMDEQMPEEED